ncbi:hypothetical protein Lal_00032009 [Lupinus albus]|nr:hypothetical protein Lal_00032009 [Lupinus albus]
MTNMVVIWWVRKDPKVGGGVGGTCKFTKDETQHSPRQIKLGCHTRRPRCTFEERGSSLAVGSRTAARRDLYFSPALQATRLAIFQGRKMANVRYVDVSWLVEQDFQFPHELEVQGTNTLIELHGKLYPSLIQEFYSNFTYKDRDYMTMVRGKIIVLDADLFLAIVGLSGSGAPLGDCENEQWETFDVVSMYKSCLRGPLYFIPGGLTKVGSLIIESSLLHYVIAYLLVQRYTNHAQPTTQDLKLMFAIREGILDCFHREIDQAKNEIDRIAFIM